MARSTLVFRGMTATSLWFHLPGPDPLTAACSSKILLNLADPYDLEFALETDTLCTRRACQDGLKALS